MNKIEKDFLLSNELCENGYVRIKKILSDDEVSNIRNTCLSKFAENKHYILTPTEFLEDKLLNTIPFSNKVIMLTKQTLNANYAFTPTFTVRKSLYIQWHTDDFFLKEPLESLSDLPEFVMCTIYLQDNNEKTGGGIEFVPGSHKLPAEERQRIIENGIDSYHFEPNKAGDLIIFDYRIIHRGTPMVEKGPQTRLAVQWFVARSNNYVNAFVDFLLLRRYEKIHLADKTGNDLTRFNHDLPNIKFPESYPVTAVQNIRLHHLAMSF